MRFFRPGIPGRWVFHEALFRIRTDEKIVCLTFDDGPDPSSTPVILEALNKNEISAIFFCCGDAAKQYPHLVKSIISEGHIIGNHTWSHSDGWKNSALSYLQDVDKAVPFTSGKYFRPPFGRMRFRQYLLLKKRFKIFFWDIMSYDFDGTLSYEESLRKTVELIRPGSVIVLHDKKRSNYAEFLNRLVEEILKKGYRFTLPVSDSV